MDTNIDTIHQFLQAFAPEASGHSAVSPDLEKAIKAFAAGELDETNLDDLSRELLTNENAMEKLASLLKGG